MFKGLTTEVAQEVGKSGAILFNQLLQWFKGQNVDKVYRTNSELAEDLCGILSPATIQRAKVALVNAGYVEVSFDKGLNRTTHYRLTEKAKSLLGEAKKAVSNVVKKVSSTFTGTGSKAEPKASQNQAPTQPKKPVAAPRQQTSQAMEESFKEGFNNSGAVPCPTSAIEKLKGLLKGKKTVEDKPVEAPLYEDDSHLFPKKQSVLDNPNDISDEEYFSSLDAVMGLAYAGVPNVEVRNENLQRAAAMNNFKGEEW